MIRPMTTGRDFRSIGVIGLGTMGAGIAEIFARNGYQVVGVELNDESLERGRQHIQHSTDRAVKRGKLSESDQQELIGRNVIPGHWTFQIVEEFDDCYYDVSRISSHVAAQRAGRCDEILRSDGRLPA